MASMARIIVAEAEKPLLCRTYLLSGFCVANGVRLVLRADTDRPDICTSDMTEFLQCSVDPSQTGQVRSLSKEDRSRLFPDLARDLE